MILHRSIGIFLALICLSVPCDAAIVAYWDFNSPITNPANVPASSGAGSLSLSGWGGSFVSNTGTTINTTPGTPAGNDLSLSAGPGLGGNGTFVQLNNISFAGLWPLSISYATQRSGTGFTTGTWSWSTNGTTFTNVAGNVSPPSTYSLITVDLSNIAALGGATNVSFRYTLLGATNPAGNNRIDNLRITAVPEPSSLLILATSVLAVPAYRRLRRKPLVASPSVQTPC